MGHSHSKLKKIAIRPNIFETNSSSSHSLVISNNKRKNKLSYLKPFEKYTDYNGDFHENCLVLTGGEFGWGVEIYKDVLTKANYLAVFLKFYDNNEEWVEMFEKVLKEDSGASKIVYEFNKDYNKPNWSYIDHQSTEVGDDAFENEDVLRNFLFNRGSILIIDNDNH